MLSPSVWPLVWEHGCDITLKGRATKKHPHRRAILTIRGNRVRECFKVVCQHTENAKINVDNTNTHKQNFFFFGRAGGRTRTPTPTTPTPTPTTPTPTTPTPTPTTPTPGLRLRKLT